MKKKLIFLALMIVLILSVCTATVFAANEPASLKITAANLSLENAVYMNFKVTHENIDRSDVKLLVWEEYPESYTKGTEDACLSAKTDVDGNTVFQYTDLSAKDMTKQIYVCAYANIDGVEYYSNSVKYSIAIYAHRMKATSTDTEFLALIDAMLEYGALSQQYFKYNTDILATAPLYEINVTNGKLEDGFSIGWYYENETATLTANEAEEGRIFSRWTNSNGETISKNPTLMISIKDSESYTAVYRNIVSEGLLYERENDYYVVTGLGDCQDTDISIPTEYNGSPVYAIGQEAFYDNDTITSIFIPETIQEIRDRAFSACSNLDDVIFMDKSSLTFIGWDAFLDCDALTTFTVPKSVTEMSNGVFARSANLKTVIFEDGIQLEMLPIDIFNDCPSLTDVTLPDSLTSIGMRAFYRCPALKSITIPESVTSIGNNAFYNCPALSNITLSNKVTYIDEGAFDTLGDLTITYNGSKDEWNTLLENSAPVLWSEATNVTVR